MADSKKTRRLKLLAHIRREAVSELTAAVEGEANLYKLVDLAHRVSDADDELVAFIKLEIPEASAYISSTKYTKNRTY